MTWQSCSTLAQLAWDKGMQKAQCCYIKIWLQRPGWMVTARRKLDLLPCFWWSSCAGRLRHKWCICCGKDQKRVHCISSGTQPYKQQHRRKHGLRGWKPPMDKSPKPRVFQTLVETKSAWTGYAHPQGRRFSFVNHCGDWDVSGRLLLYDCSSFFTWYSILFIVQQRPHSHQPKKQYGFRAES